MNAYWFGRELLELAPRQSISTKLMITPCPNVWMLDTSALSERELDAARAVLSREEIDLAFRLDLKTDHVRYTSAHCLARIALAQAAGCEPAHLRFGKGIYGRPYVTAPLAARHLWFNLSHTEGLVGIAISRYPVGLDVESIGREINFLEVAEDILTEAEIRSLLPLEPVEMRRRFFQLWTLKEAYLKAIGSGFLGEPKSFSFEKNGNCLTFRPPGDGAAEWTFLSQFHGKTHCLALCYASHNDTPRFHDGRELFIGSLR